MREFPYALHESHALLTFFRSSPSLGGDVPLCFRADTDLVDMVVAVRTWPSGGLPCMIVGGKGIAYDNTEVPMGSPGESRLVPEAEDAYMESFWIPFLD